MKGIITAIIMCITTIPAMAEPVETTLKDYAFDFSSVGYEISFFANTRYFSDPMNPFDYFKVSADGYTMKAKADGLSRNGLKSFIAYFNDNCKFRFAARHKCSIRISGEVKIDEDFRMLISAKKIDFLNKETHEIIKTFE